MSSLPKQSNLPTSPSPLRSSSLRSQLQQKPTPRTLLPSPRFTEHSAATLDNSVDDDGDVEHDTPQAQAESEESLEEGPQHNFQPLFTLLSDARSHEHYHPTVHYIFADDDTDIITEAALRSLELPPSDQTEVGGFSTQSTTATAEKEEVKERYILLDIAGPAPAPNTTQPPTHPSSDPTPINITTTTAKYPFTVTHASSLSPSFAVLSAEITAAPTFESNSPVSARARRDRQRSSSLNEGLGTTTQEQQGLGGGSATGGTGAAGAGPAWGVEAGEGLMLKITGVSLPSFQSHSMNTDDEAEGDALEDLLDRFEARLAEIKSVVQASETLSGIEATELDPIEHEDTTVE